MTLEVEVFPVRYYTRGFVQYSDETCQPTYNVIPEQAVCRPLHEGRVPQLIDCNFGPLTETPTNESFYSVGSGNRTIFIFDPAVHLTKVILHHYCATTNTNQLPFVLIRKGVEGSGVYYNILVSVRDESHFGNFFRITCECAGQRGNTTLTIDQSEGGNPRPFSRLLLLVNVGMGTETFELSEVQFFTEDTSNPGMYYV